MSKFILDYLEKSTKFDIALIEINLNSKGIYTELIEAMTNKKNIKKTFYNLSEENREDLIFYLQTF